MQTSRFTGVEATQTEATRQAKAGYKARHHGKTVYGPHEGYLSIDGNPLRDPVGYCQYHNGYISGKQAKVHGCFRKHGGPCGQFQNMRGDSIRKMNQQQYYDKQIDRLDKMIVALNKLAKALEAIQKVNEQAAEMMNKYTEQLEETAVEE